MPTTLGSAINFLQDFGFFDVILPFLLVFTIVFGILEKTRIFGVEKINGVEYPKKAINSMIAFVIGFFVVAAREVVQSLQVSLPQVILVLIVLVSFMMLAGSFMSDKEFSFENRPGWKIFLTTTIFIAIILIFMNSFGLLQPIIDYMSNTTYLVAPTVFLLVVLGAILYIVGGKPKGSGSSGASGGSE